VTAGAAITIVSWAGTQIPQRIIAMAADTRRCDGHVVTRSVAIRAWQRAMQANHVATYPRVIEARWRKRPLGMALTTTRRQRIAVNIVLAVTVDAHVPSALQRSIIAMAAFARNIVVSAGQREVTHIVEWLNIGERLGVMALLARGAVLAFVHIRLRVTAITVDWPRLERLRRMAVRAPDIQVFAFQLKLRHRVVIELIVTGFDVAAFAFVTEPTFVHVVVGVAALRRTVLRRPGIFAGWVTVFAFVLFVLAFERPFGVFVVGKFQRSPRARGMAARASFT
jgi:hypothetical protein